MTAIGLLISCAMLAASWPIVARRSLRTSCCCAACSAAVRSATLASSSSPQRCSARVLSSTVSSRWSSVAPSRSISPSACSGPTRAAWPDSTRCIVSVMRSSGRKMRAAERSDHQAASSITTKNSSPMPASTAYFTTTKGRSRKPTYSMPTRRPPASASGR